MYLIHQITISGHYGASERESVAAEDVPVSPAANKHQTTLDGLGTHSSFAQVSTEVDRLSLRGL